VERPREPFEIDRSVAHPARMYNHLVGGKANFTVDREVAEYLIEALPGGMETFQATARATAVFLYRTVRYVAKESGIRQFLNVFTPVPTPYDLRDVAREFVPDARFVYVSDDPVVAAHAHALQDSTPEGATAYVHCAFHDVPTIVREAAATLDFTRPVAVMLVGTLNFVPDPQATFTELLQAVPSGSYLAVTDMANDMQVDDMAEAFRRTDEMVQQTKATAVLHSRAEVSRFFEGLEMVGTGLVPLNQWHQYKTEPLPVSERIIPAYAALARKP
jgi:S-adenosyl methyltransferase